MHEDINQPGLASPGGADVPNEFAVYEDEETPAPYLPLPSESPRQFAGQARPAPIADAPESPLPPTDNR